MATAGRGTDRSVAERLHDDAPRFSFYQAVKLLEMLRPEATPVAEGTEPDQEAVRFHSAVSFSFPGTALAAVDWDGDAAGQADMTVNFMGLAGAVGPLPAAYTSLLLERLDDGDTILRDFLDLFNHRLVALMYRVRKAYRPGFAYESPRQDRFTRYLLALIGLDPTGLRHREAIPDQTLLRYAGLLTHQSRSAVGLACLLSDYFSVDVAVQQGRGAWVDLDEQEWTAIGTAGCHNRLGQGFMLGQRVYETSGRLELRVGPLSLQEYRDFLPEGGAFEALCALARFYVRHELDFDLCLLLKGADVPACRLGGVHGPRLGWDTWLKTPGAPPLDGVQAVYVTVPV